MKTKNRTYTEDFVSTKKKFSKCHDPFVRKTKQFDTGVVADKNGRLVNVRDWISFSHAEELLQGEVTEVHAENKLTVSWDNPITNQVCTCVVKAWEVTVLN